MKRKEPTVGEVLQSLWCKACEHDGVPPASKFVVFSDGNPWAEMHSRAMLQYQQTRAEYLAGGYIGMKIEGGKARGKFICAAG